MKTNFTKCRFLVTPQIITVILEDKMYQFTSEKRNFERVKDCIRSGDEEALIDEIAAMVYIIPEYSNGLFKIHDSEDRIIDIETDTNVGDILGSRILEWARDGLPFEPLLNFHRNCILNTSEQSVVNLYDFLEKNHVPITNDGMFIGYKKVTTVKGVLMDSHTKKINNNVGTVVKMPRHMVNSNPNETCAAGLHVGAWQYVEGFNGDTIIAVKVHPKDVVAVPKDYDSQKMRVCEYKVLNIAGKEILTAMVEDKHETGVSEIPAFEKMTANEIIIFIEEEFDYHIDISVKNKKAIVKAAYKFYNN